MKQFIEQLFESAWLSTWNMWIDRYISVSVYFYYINSPNTGSLVAHTLQSHKSVHPSTSMWRKFLYCLAECLSSGMSEEDRIAYISGYFLDLSKTRA